VFVLGTSSGRGGDGDRRSEYAVVGGGVMSLDGTGVGSRDEDAGVSVGTGACPIESSPAGV